MKKTFTITGLILLLLLTGMPAFAEVDVTVFSTLNLEEEPLDIAISKDGMWVYVLTDKGWVRVYSADGKLNATIAVGKEVDEIEAGPREDILFLKSRKEKSVQIITYEIIKEIDISKAPVKGEDDAPVTVTVFSDFECPYCSRVVPLVDQMLEKNPEDVKIAFKHFPLRSHKLALPAARASIAAQRQGKFWEFHDRLFAEKNLSEQKIREVAKELDLDMEKFEADMKDDALGRQIQQDIADATEIGVRGTPTIFVNGRKLRNRSPQGFQTAIDEALKSSSGEKETAEKADGTEG